MMEERERERALIKRGLLLGAIKGPVCSALFFPASYSQNGEGRASLFFIIPSSFSFVRFFVLFLLSSFSCARGYVFFPGVSRLGKTMAVSDFAYFSR